MTLIGAALWLRASPWLREPVLRGKSLPELEATVRERSGDPLARYYLAKAYYLNRRFDDAQREYAAATRLDPASARAHLGLGLTLCELGRTGEAETALQRALVLDRRLAWAEYTLGKLRWQQGDVRGALSHLERSTKLDPRSGQAWYGLATCYSQSGQHQEAIAALQEAVKRPGAGPRHHTALGELLVYRGRTEEGRTHLEEALRLDPRHAPACAQLGRFYLRSAVGADALNRAEALLTRASRLKSAHPAQVWSDLGQVYTRKGEYGRAIACLRESLRHDARDERAYYLLATAHRRAGNAAAADGAEARFRRISALHVAMQEKKGVISHDPANVPVRLELARIYTGLRLFNEAAEQYLAALRLRPDAVGIGKEWKTFRQKHAGAAPAGPPEFAMPSPG